MTITNQQLQEWLTARENEHLEFKEAKNNFHFEKVVKYCAAPANDGGGSVVLGVTDKAHSIGRTKGGRWYPGGTTK